MSRNNEPVLKEREDVPNRFSLEEVVKYNAGIKKIIQECHLRVKKEFEDQGIPFGRKELNIHTYEILRNKIEQPNLDQLSAQLVGQLTQTGTELEIATQSITRRRDYLIEMFCRRLSFEIFCIICNETTEKISHKPQKKSMELTSRGYQDSSHFEF